jgi:glutamyl-tRNA synthetase
MPESLRNYLLRLGWSFKDKEIFTLDESIKHFNIEGIGKSPSKLDMSRILSMNEHYIKNMNENDLYDQLKKFCGNYKDKIDSKGEIIKKSLSFLKNKAKTLDDILNNAQYIIRDNIKINQEDAKLLDNISKNVLSDFQTEFEKLPSINKENLEKILNGLINKHKTNFKGVGQPLRIALVGSKFGPGIYDIILSLDKNEVIKRLKAVT